MALTTVSAYKTYAGISGSGEDTLLGVLLGIAENQVRRACGRNLDTGFEKATRTETYDGTGGTTIQLREWPIVSITSVTEIDDAGGETVLDDSEYRVNSLNGVLFRVGAQFARFPVDAWGRPYVSDFGPAPCWADGFQNIEVVYSGGHDVSGGEVPEDLVGAIFRLIDIAYAQRRQDPSKQSESIGAYSYTMKAAAETDAAFLSLVAPFKTGVP